MTISFYATGIPKAQPRPRAFARKLPNGKVIVRAYEAATAEGWKSAVAIAARRRLPAKPLEGPLRVDIVFNMPRPRSHFKGKTNTVKDNSPCWHTIKPDRDNLEKAVLDALSTIGMWADDCQVCCGEVKKTYAIENSQPGAAITITKL